MNVPQTMVAVRARAQTMMVDTSVAAVLALLSMLINTVVMVTHWFKSHILITTSTGFQLSYNLNSQPLENRDRASILSDTLK